MIATAFAFVVGIFMIPWVIALFISFALYAEYKESSGWGIFYLAVATFGLFLLFSPSWALVGYITLGYLPVGLAWSVFRYRRWVNKQVKAFNEEWPANKPDSKSNGKRSYHVSALADRTEPKRNVKKMVYWTFNWPISMVESALDDLIAAVEHLITKTLKKVYHKMWTGALDGIEPEPEKTVITEVDHRPV